MYVEENSFDEDALVDFVSLNLDSANGFGLVQWASWSSFHTFCIALVTR